MQDADLTTEFLNIFVLPFLALLGGEEEGAEETDGQADTQLHWLRSLGDREALFQLLEDNRQLTQGLDIAEALAELGDVRGMDHLIAMVKSPSPYLSHAAARILKRLNHPRGLRALKEQQPSPDAPSAGAGASAPGSGSKQDAMYLDLSQRDTDELIAIWHENDSSQASEQALQVLEEVLTERLGHLPDGDEVGGTEGRDEDEIDEQTAAEVKSPWMGGDIEGLVHMLNYHPDPVLRLDAAEALADLQDARGLDYLTTALDDPDEDLKEVAAELLDWLDVPTGNEALRAHGYEFEKGRAGGEEDIFDLPRQEYLPDIQRSAELDPSWAAYERMQLELEQRQRRMAPESMEQRRAKPGAGYSQGTGTSGASSAIILGGAVGGLLGLVTLNAALYAWGSLPPQGIAAAVWLRAILLYYVPTSIVTGVAAALIGRRITQAIEGPTVVEASEWGINPLFSALLTSAAAALLVDVLLLLLVGV
jgi:hypothetical protein